MCLIVTDVPTSQKDALIVPCWKMISVRLDSSGYRSFSYNTSYQGARVPTNGILKPHRKTQIIDFYLGRVINGGFIHAYIDKPRNTNFGYLCLQAYAIKVCAYGSERNNDLICRTLYIPSLDFMLYGQEERMEAVLNPTPKKILRVFGV